MSFDLNAVIRGRVWKFGDSVDTDVINPFYRYPSEEEVRLHTMEAYRPEFPNEVKQGDILVAGRNFGCGSARPIAVLYSVGIAAIVAESMSRLALRNCISLAQPVFMAPGITSMVDDGEQLEIDYPGGIVRNVKSGAEIALQKYPQAIEGFFAAGGILEFAHKRYVDEMSS